MRSLVFLLTFTIVTDSARSDVSYSGCSTIAQSIRGELFCDGVYHCLDRYDVSVAACGKDKNFTLSADYPEQSDSVSELVSKAFFALPALMLLLLALFKFFTRSRAYLTALAFGNGRHVSSKQDGPQYYRISEANLCLIPSHILKPQEFHGPSRSGWPDYRDLIQ